MARYAAVLLLVAFASPVRSQDNHFSEPGSGVILSHSVFAHGYRHGYEEGYHAGNTDANMGRLLRAKPEQCPGLKMTYARQYGPRSVFEKGFRAGLMAGYNDGYMGRTFRAVRSLRILGTTLPEVATADDPQFTHFDLGFFAGYNDGLDGASADTDSAAESAFRQTDCAKFP